MMKVRCISDELRFVTKNKIYEVKGIKTLYIVKADRGEKIGYEKSYFEPIQEEKSLQKDLQDKAKQDNVNRPSHYNTKSMECKDIINVMCEGLEGNKAYCMGAIVKYLYRFENKGKPVEDLKKAKTYIDMIIDELEVD